jgi:hypothetical protein
MMTMTTTTMTNTHHVHDRTMDYSSLVEESSPLIITLMFGGLDGIADAVDDDDDDDVNDVDICRHSSQQQQQ